MSAGENAPRRGTAAIVVATAAITLAIGVTAAALGGYLGPRDQPQAPPAANAAPPVLLVPVTNQPAAEQPQAVPAPDEATPVWTEDRRRDEHERDEGTRVLAGYRRHHEHEREHDRDDDEHEDDD